MFRPIISAQQWKCSLCVVQLSQPSSGDVVYVSSSYLSQVVEMQFTCSPVISGQQWRCSLCSRVISAQQWRCSLCVVQLSQLSNGDVVQVSSRYLSPVVQMQFMCRPVISTQQWRCSSCVVQFSQPSSGDENYLSSSYLCHVVQMQFM